MAISRLFYLVCRGDQWHSQSMHGNAQKDRDEGDATQYKRAHSIRHNSTQHNSIQYNTTQYHVYYIVSVPYKVHSSMYTYIHIYTHMYIHPKSDRQHPRSNKHIGKGYVPDPDIGSFQYPISNIQGPNERTCMHQRY